MSTENVKTLYGLKINDVVRYIGDETRHVKEFIGKEGKIVEIEPIGGQFHVELEGVSYLVSFARQDLLLVEAGQNEVDFEGVLVDTQNLTAEEMRNYLNKYHEFKEGINYAITNRVVDNTEIKEVYFDNKSYTRFMADLLAIEKSRVILGGTDVEEFYRTYRSKSQPGGAVTLSFKASDWTFTTHVLGWQVQRYMCGFFGIDLYREMGFENV